MHKKFAAAVLLLAVMCGSSWGASTATDYDPYNLHFWYNNPAYESQVYGAYGNSDYNFFYQLRDITGASRTEQVGGPQWFATVYENYYYTIRNALTNNTNTNNRVTYGIYRRTTGGGMPDITFSTVGDIIDGFNFVFAEEPQPYASAWRRYIGTDTEIYDVYPDPVESICIVTSNGTADMNIDFGNPYARHFPFWWGLRTTGASSSGKWWQGGYDWRNETYPTAEPIAYIYSAPDIYARSNNGRYEKMYKYVSYDKTVSSDSSPDVTVTVNVKEIQNTAGAAVYTISGDIGAELKICDSSDNVLYTVSGDSSNGTFAYTKVYNASGNLAYTIEINDGDMFICENRDVNESITVSDFDQYYTVTVNPSGEHAISSGGALGATLRLRALDPSFYGSRLGYLTFRQRASFAPGYANYREFSAIPLVVANVSSGNASDNPLMFDMIVFDSQDVVNRIKFTWDAQADNPGQDLGTFFMIGSRDKTYQLETRITNRTGTRYELYRYDMTSSRNGNPTNRDGYASIMPDYWRYDLTPDMYGTLPDYFLLDAHSQIAPGLVTVYKSNIGEGYRTISTQDGTSESFRLYEYSSATPRNLRLSYKSVGGMTLLQEESPDASVRVQEFSMQFADVVNNEDETVYELTNLMGKPPIMRPAAATTSRSTGRNNAGTHANSVYINSSAVDAFRYTYALPDDVLAMMTYDVISDDEEASEDNAAPAPEPESEEAPQEDTETAAFRLSDVTLVSKEIAIQPLAVRMRIPRQNRLIVNHWDEFDNAANTRELFNAFARYCTVWLRSDYAGERDANLFTAITNKGANTATGPADCVRAFLYDDELYLDFIVVLADGTSRNNGKTAYVEIFKDDGVPYILIGDGNEDGVWDMTFYVGATGENPEPRTDSDTTTPVSDDSTQQNASPSEDSGGSGGCEAGFSAAAIAAIFALAGAFRKR
ncbi:MAG: hypothetical protein IJT02_07165 [Synergistaceae bacterium]|nr:hypothetical protein [Synergistaceae bacterium]